MHRFSHDFSLDSILNISKIKPKRTKMICTIGPASNDVETLKNLIKNGMTIARLNFSHGDHESHLKILNNVKEAIRMTGSEGRVGIMLDTKGPEIRTGFLESGGKVDFKKGQTLKITGDYSVKGNSEIIALSYSKVVSVMKPGQNILIADGNLSLQVREVDEENNLLITTVMNNFSLGERKNVNLPGVKVDLPVITEKDHHDIVNFGVKHQVDYVALSFSRSKHCIESCRKVLGTAGKDIQIIPKIENEEGIVNIVEIIEASDGLMMARGDLGMELNPSKLLIAQKYMTNHCRRLGKPVICATQMLESMTKNSRPTRAEMSDVGNAVLDSVDSVMLSGETGSGMFVLESAQIMTGICREVEASFNYREYYKSMKKKLQKSGKISEKNALDILAKSAVKLSFSLGSNAMIVLDQSGKLVRKISELRPNAFIISPNSNLSVLNKMTLCFGVVGIYSQPQNYVEDSVRYILSHGLEKNGSNVVVVNIVQNQIQIYEIK